MGEKQNDFSSLLEKVKKIKEDAGVDLSTSEDLSLAVMNLIALEEHFFFTGVKTEDQQYFDTGVEVRELRKKLLAELMPEHEGETWCASKHLLSATMRLVEVGYKLKASGQQAEAADKFNQAYKVYTVFWMLKLKLAGVREKKNDEQKTARLEHIISQLANCCDE